MASRAALVKNARPGLTVVVSDKGIHHAASNATAARNDARQTKTAANARHLPELNP
jgi:hypothetical protein